MIFRNLDSVESACHINETEMMITPAAVSTGQALLTCVIPDPVVKGVMERDTWQWFQFPHNPNDFRVRLQIPTRQYFVILATSLESAVAEQTSAVAGEKQGKTQYQTFHIFQGPGARADQQIICISETLVVGF